jgi:hypothetical protein
MKREILFKAKRTDNGGWIEGVLAYFFDNKETPYIMPKCYFATREMGEDENDETIISDEICFGGFISVQTDTVCQFTGLTDKNGNKIFEGDKIVFSDHKIVQVVEFRKGQFMAKQLGTVGSYIGLGYCDWEKESEIIGNIHD